MYHFKSKHESKFAVWLERSVELCYIKSWAYEPQTFIFDWIQCGTRSYCPDFCVNWFDAPDKPATHAIWYECKTYIVKRDNTKWRRLLKLHPDLKLVIVFDGPRKKERAKIDQRIPLARVTDFKELGVT